MANRVRDPEAIKYRKLFEYMKQYGIDPFRDFFTDYNELQKKDLLMGAILDGKHQTLSFARKHGDVLRIIRKLEDNSKTFFSKDFSYIFDTVSEDNLSKCIEGAYALEDLGVVKISYGPVSWPNSNTYIYYNAKGRIDAIEKFYTNGDISYRSLSPDWDKDNPVFFTLISFPEQSTGSFIIHAQNQGIIGYRYAYISDFCFDPSLLPSSYELSLLEPPQSLKESKVYEYVKR